MNENVKWPVKCSQQARENEPKSLKILEASTGIEPVYTDLQSAA